ncbi:MAG: hypothetical protein ACOC5L_03855 [Halobacteriota archaeon]
MGEEETNKGEEVPEVFKEAIDYFLDNKKDTLEYLHVINSDYLFGRDIRESLRRFRIVDAFEGINSYLQDNPHLNGDFKATVERDIEDPSIEINRIRVEIDVDNLQEWAEAKQSIREIVARAEKGDVEIYPIVDRKRD